MTSPGPDILDLRNELLILKKQFGDSKSENTILKVKIRRMQEELLRKNRELQALLNPNKVINRRIMTEQGTSLILNLKDQMEDLKTQIHVRDFQIKKLQNQLLAARVYDKNACYAKNVFDDVQSSNNTNGNKKNTRNFNNLDIYLHKPGDGCVGSCSPSPISEFSHAIDNLQKNISKIKQNCEGQDDCACYLENSRSTSCSPNACLEKSSQTAHQELEDLTNYVIQMTLELENLKTNFMQLQREKFTRSKSAEPKLGAKNYNPKLILVQPKGTADIKADNCCPVIQAARDKAIQRNGKFLVKTAFEEKIKYIPTPKKGAEACQRRSYGGVCKYIDETDSVSEIIFLN